MKKTTLVVMAAGIGSRFGGGIKQLEPVGPNGEIIMDYSIHDAMEAGFNKVVFIIRKDLEKDFREIIGNRIEKLIEMCIRDRYRTIYHLSGDQITFTGTRGWTRYSHEGRSGFSAKDYLEPTEFFSDGVSEGIQPFYDPVQEM